jgi:HSF-type DNA-binding
MNIQQQLQLLAAELKRQAGPAHVNSTVVGANVSSGIARASRQDPTAPVSSVSESSSNAQLFPYILHALLEDVEKVGPATSIVSWSPDGSSVHVKDQQVFETTILPSYFPHLRGPLAYSKFQSLLKDWGFDQLGAGVFLHPCFQKSNISMCRFMRCGRKEEDQGSVNTHSLQSIFPSQSMPDALSVSPMRF